MDTLSEMFVNGGPWMYGVVMALFASLGVASAAGILSAYRRRVPLLVWVSCPAAGVALGMVGWLTGLAMLSKAIGFAVPEQVDRLRFTGMKIAQYTEVSGWTAAAAGLFASALCIALGQLIGAGPGARWRFARAALAALVCLGAAAVTGALIVTRGPADSNWIWIPVALLAGGACPVAMVSLREGVEELDARRAVAARLGAGFCVALAVGSSLAAAHGESWILAHHAMGADTLDPIAAKLRSASDLANAAAGIHNRAR